MKKTHISIRFSVETFQTEFLDDPVQIDLIEFMELQGGSLAVEGVDDDASRADAADAFQPTGPFGIHGIVECPTLPLTAEEHCLDDEIAEIGRAHV